MKPRKIDLIYKNLGTASATKTIQTALSISRSNALDSTSGSTPPLMSAEGSALAKNSAPRSAFDVPYLDDPRKKFSVSDREVAAWRKFQIGDMTEWDDPEGESDPDYKLFCLNERSEAERFDPGRKRQIDEQEPEFDEEGEEELEAEENEALARTRGAFDRGRLYRAIDRLTRRTKKRLRGHDGRSYARDDRGRSYSACTGMIGGVEAWNEAFARGEVC